MKHHILISVGSNIDKAINTLKGVEKLSEAFYQLECSPVYESEAVGFKGNSFYNLAVSAYTNLSLSQVVSTLKTIEIECGRKKNKEKFSDRAIDLDLLTFDQVVCEKPVILPREEILYNAFVLKPLADLVPEHRHPKVLKSYKELWQEYDKSSQKLWRIDFSWSEITL